MNEKNRTQFSIPVFSKNSTDPNLFKELANLKNENITLKQTIAKLENFRDIGQIELKKYRSIQEQIKIERENYKKTFEAQRLEISNLKNKFLDDYNPQDFQQLEADFEK